MNKHFENLLKLQCFGQEAYGRRNCAPCRLSCHPPCPPPCIVYKTVTRIVNPAPAPVPVPVVTPQYAYIFNDGRQTVAMADGVAFGNNGTLSAGITHTKGAKIVTIRDPGTYGFWFTVTGTTANQFALFLNGASIPSTYYGSEPGAAGSTARPITTGFAVATITGESTLALVNSTGAAVTLATGVGGAASNVNASVMIIKIA